MIYIVIPVFNRLNFTTACIDSLLAQDYVDFKIIIVDHGSTDGTYDYLSSHYPSVIVLSGTDTMWWAAATNMGVRYAMTHHADYVLTLNNDLIVAPDYLSSIYNLALRYPQSLIGSATIDIDNKNKIVYAGTRWSPWTAYYQPAMDRHQEYTTYLADHEIVSSDVLPGRGTLIPISAFLNAGLFNEKDFPHYAADEDFSLRCKKLGYQLMISVKASVYSHLGATGVNHSLESLSITQFLKSMSSMKSAINVKRRWLWACNHGKIPALYFMLDYARILLSFIKSKLK